MISRRSSGPKPRGERPPTETLHEYITLADQTKRQRAVVLVAEIEVGVLLAESGFDIEAEDVIQVWIAAVNYLCAVFGEELADRRARDDVGEVEDAQPFERPADRWFQGDRLARREAFELDRQNVGDARP